jgi:transposase
VRLETRIRILTLNGKSQKQIAELLGRPRGFVHRHQKKLGLLAQRHGPRSPELTEAQRVEVLNLLRTGMGTKKVAAQLGLRWHAVRKVSETHGFSHIRGTGRRYRVSDAKREQIAEEIVERRTFCRTLAHRHGVSDKYVRKLAHELLGVPQFRGGYGEPLTSNFPLKQKRVNAD